MKEVILYKSKWKAFKLLLLIMPFVAIGLLMILKGEKQVIGWLSLFFFGGLGIPMVFFNLFDKRPQIKINENGIWDRTTKEDEIKWEQIKGAYIISIHRQKFISLQVDDTFVCKRKQYKWAAEMTQNIGAQKLNLSLGEIKVDPKKLLAFIQEMINTTRENRAGVIIEYFGY